MRRARVALVIVIVISYFLFSSGFVYEISGSTTTTRMDTPFSFAFSADRVDLIGLPTHDDLSAVKWISQHALPKIPIQSGYDGVLLLWGFGMQDRITNEDYVNTRYVFIMSKYSKTGRWEEGRNGGLRILKPIPKIDSDKLVFQSGDAKVYFVRS